VTKRTMKKTRPIEKVQPKINRKPGQVAAPTVQDLRRAILKVFIDTGGLSELMRTHPQQAQRVINRLPPDLRPASTANPE
jgi:hypothetical protein